MPVYAEPVAPLGPLYQAPGPRGGARAATDGAFAGWSTGLEPIGDGLEAGQSNLEAARTNLASLDGGIATAQDAWNNSGAREGITADATALNQPNPVGGPTIPLSLNVPQMPSGTSPVAGLAHWLADNVYGYLYQLRGYLYGLGLPPENIPPVYYPPRG